MLFFRNKILRFYEKCFFEFLYNHRIYRFGDEFSDKKLDTVLFLKGMRIPILDRIHAYDDNRFIWYGSG